MTNNNSNNSSLRKQVSFVSSPQSPPRSEPSSDQQQQQQEQEHVSSHSCHYYCDGLSQQDRRAILWYSPEDLQHCRAEAKDTIQQLQARLEQGTLDLLPEDVCLRGIEKYADAATKYRKQRMYMDSILSQQRAIQEQPSKQDDDVVVENLANLSRYLSQGSTALALFYAGRCAAELSLLRHEEEDEEDDEEEYEEEISSTCSSEIDVHESKVSTIELCSEPTTVVDVSSKRKRSRCSAFGDSSMPPRKIQCCE